MAIDKPAGGEMPFLDHLEELRWRIIYSLIAIVIGLGIGLYFAFAYNIIGTLQQPILPYMNGRRLGILHPMDGFTIRLHIAFGIALILAAPIVGYQIWAFLAPALHKPEKRVVLPVLFAAAILFLIGAAMAWFFVLPMTIKWLSILNGDTFELNYVATEYFSMAINLVLAFGAAFEVPLLLVTLVALGLLSASLLNRSRKFAVLIIFVLAAVISPGDAVSATLALAIPLYLLYELSIVVAFMIEKRRRLKKEREDKEAELAAPA
jgi:sec-independent protein translocase protein TatC